MSRRVATGPKPPANAIGGVSARRVDESVRAMGLSGISKSTVPKLCEDIDERVGEFLDRPLASNQPYVRMDATYLKVRQGGRPFGPCPAPKCERRRDNRLRC